VWDNAEPFPCLFSGFGSCKWEVAKVEEYTGVVVKEEMNLKTNMEMVREYGWERN